MMNFRGDNTEQGLNSKVSKIFFAFMLQLLYVTFYYAKVISPDQFSIT